MVSIQPCTSPTFSHFLSPTFPLPFSLQRKGKKNSREGKMRKGGLDVKIALGAKKNRNKTKILRANCCVK